MARRGGWRMAPWPMVAGMAFLALLASPAEAGPGDMSVAAFLAKVDALKAKGPLALFSADIGRLKAEATAAGVGYADRLKAERVEGHPSSCPPRGAKPDQDMWLTHLRGYSAEVRPRVSLNRAMADLYAKTWPCR